MTDAHPASRLGRVNVENDHATLTFERRLPHPPEEVWAAITEPGQLAEWYMTDAKIEGRVGGSIDYWSGPSRLHITGRILIWDPPHVFEHEWSVEPRPELPKGEESIIRWEIASLGGKDSALKLTHRHLTRRTAMGFVSGTHAFLDRLEAQLNETSLPGWMARFEEVRKSYPDWNE